jgi:hypothetical protein
MQREHARYAGRLPCLGDLDEGETRGALASYLEDLADRLLDPAAGDRRLVG